MTTPDLYADPKRPRAERIAALGYDYAAQEKGPIAPCNLCGADRFAILTHRDRYGFPAQAMTCTACGLTLLNPRMTAAAYARFYEGVYRPLVSAYHGRLIDARSVKAEQVAYAEEMDRLFAPYLAGLAGRALLDVGGSTGVIAAHLTRRYGLRATVLDPAPDEIAEADALGIETVTGLVEEWDPAGRRFPVVGMFQTIDHLLDVAATLAKLRALVTDDGLFLVDVVDFRAAYLKNWSVERAVKIDHPYSLTEETAEAYFARAGFEPVRKAVSADHHLVAYVCRPVAPVPGALPPAGHARDLLREARFVQNAPRPGGAA
jgi:2-polyprenyl-3-methyl-5-hydroxy-6-metoxy-1,4-benzoquinol methylase